MNVYNIACCTDDNYVQHSMAMLCSLFENNKKYSFAIHILGNNISNKNKSELESLIFRYKHWVKFYPVDETKLEGVQFRKKNPLTKAAYYRLLLSSILHDIDTVLYLDCDLIVLGDVKELFDIDLTNYALAACLEAMPTNNTHRIQLNLTVGANCFCSGVMLVNLKYWRKNDVEKKLVFFATHKKREPVYLHDQDVLNYAFNQKWFILSPKWNRASYASNLRFSHYKKIDYIDMFFNPSIIHYNNHSAKPWYNVHSPKRKYYLKYLKISGFTNPKFINVSFKSKIFIYFANTSSFLSAYVAPFTPEIICILLKDIKNILKTIALLTLFLIGKKNMKDLINALFRVPL